MTTEQGSGGGALGGSPPRPNMNAQAEPLPETEVETRLSQKQEDSQPQYNQPSQSPRVAETLSTPTRTPSTSPSPRPSAFRSASSTAPKSFYPSQRSEPPVTKATLSELDVTKIIHNPKLRHDINFDPDLHFRPNLEGEKGRRKQEKANLFWNALESQLCQFVVDRDAFYAEHGEGGDWCLPALLRAVKDIIQTLVPQRDRAYLEEGLNVVLLMQQFNRGVADLEKLASWLSQVLKSHCAPMRDEWVDEMYNQLSNGNRNNDPRELVKGMRSLLSVLEAMKLDVANHQIRCLRPVLIEDTVHFEQRFFLKRIHAGKLDISEAKFWYQTARDAYQPNASRTQAFGDMAVFFDALSSLLLPSSDKPMPNTFIFDDERILKLRSDMTDIVNLEICMKVYEQVEPQYRSRMDSELPGYGGSLRPGTPDSFSHPYGSRPSSVIFGSPTGSTHTSPRSSLIFQSQTSDYFTQDNSKSQELYNSLIALLQTAPPAVNAAARWEAIAPAMALQVFRYTNAPPQELHAIEDRIAEGLKPGPMLHRVESRIRRKLMDELARKVKHYRGLSGVNLFSVATGGRMQSAGRAWEGLAEHDRDCILTDGSGRESREDENVEDMAIRLAHLGVMHWRVWASLAYTEDVEMTADRE